LNGDHCSLAETGIPEQKWYSLPCRLTDVETGYCFILLVKTIKAYYSLTGTIT
jgi:hypothetical protein